MAFLVASFVLLAVLQLCVSMVLVLLGRLARYAAYVLYIFCFGPLVEAVTLTGCDWV